jgi:hypothetical protein
VEGLIGEGKTLLEILDLDIPAGDRIWALTRLLGLIDRNELNGEFARWCALQVVDMWDCPDIVRDYLETGNEANMENAWDDVLRMANNSYTGKPTEQKTTCFAAWSALYGIMGNTLRAASYAAAHVAAIATDYEPAWAEIRQKQLEKLRELVK